MLDRLAALPKIGCGTLILALLSGWVVFKLAGVQAGRITVFVVFFGIIGTSVLAAIVGPRNVTPATPTDEADEPTTEEWRP
jgi:hypothetical protein